jgi:transcriptional regulator with XRE-family HTH domain
MNYGEKVKKIRKYFNLSQKDFGEKIGLKANSVSNIENNINTLTEKNIKLICSEFNINNNWLTKDEGDMFCDDNKDEDDYLAKIDYIMTGENNFHKNLFKTFALLDEKELDALENIINKFIQVKKESKE